MEMFRILRLKQHHVPARLWILVFLKSGRGERLHPTAGREALSSALTSHLPQACARRMQKRGSGSEAASPARGLEKAGLSCSGSQASLPGAGHSLQWGRRWLRGTPPLVPGSTVGGLDGARARRKHRLSNKGLQFHVHYVPGAERAAWKVLSPRLRAPAHKGHVRPILQVRKPSWRRCVYQTLSSEAPSARDFPTTETGGVCLV